MFHHRRPIFRGGIVRRKSYQAKLMPKIHFRNQQASKVYALSYSIKYECTK
jgi:hypothetical protein